MSDATFVLHQESALLSLHSPAAVRLMIEHGMDPADRLMIPLDRAAATAACYLLCNAGLDVDTQRSH